MESDIKAYKRRSKFSSFLRRFKKFLQILNSSFFAPLFLPAPRGRVARATRFKKGPVEMSALPSSSCPASVVRKAQHPLTYSSGILDFTVLPKAAHPELWDVFKEDTEWGGYVDADAHDIYDDVDDGDDEDDDRKQPPLVGVSFTSSHRMSISTFRGGGVCWQDGNHLRRCVGPIIA